MTDTMCKLTGRQGSAMPRQGGMQDVTHVGG
jgi:hypothetical protein